MNKNVDIRDVNIFDIIGARNENKKGVENTLINTHLVHEVNIYEVSSA